MADRSLAIRLAVIDGGKVKAELREVGETGSRSLQRIEDAARPASRALQVLDGVAGELRGGLETMIELRAMLALGSGRYAVEDWPSALVAVGENPDTRGADVYLSTPQAADYLEDSLTQFGFHCDDAAMERL
jgi:hypothetical protein